MSFHSVSRMLPLSSPGYLGSRQWLFKDLVSSTVIFAENRLLFRPFREVFQCPEVVDPFLLIIIHRHPSSFHLVWAFYHDHPFRPFHVIGVQKWVGHCRRVTTPGQWLFIAVWYVHRYTCIHPYSVCPPRDTFLLQVNIMSQFPKGYFLHWKQALSSELPYFDTLSHLTAHISTSSPIHTYNCLHCVVLF